MEFYKAIKNRKTIREFEDKKVDISTLQKILDCGFQAPTNDHMRQWEFIIVDDINIRAALVGEAGENIDPDSWDAESIVDSWGFTDPKQREMYFNAIPLQKKMIIKAGALIIPCFYQPKPLLKPNNLSDLNFFASIWCCIENILLAAAAEGIFGVTRIPFAPERLKAVFKCS